MQVTFHTIIKYILLGPEEGLLHDEAFPAYGNAPPPSPPPHTFAIFNSHTSLWLPLLLPACVLATRSQSPALGDGWRM